jgi:hypothetical protein
VKGPVGALNTEVASTKIVATAAENLTMMRSRLELENEEFAVLGGE